MSGFDVYPAAEAFTRRGWVLRQASVVGGSGWASLDSPDGEVWGVTTGADGFTVTVSSWDSTLTVAIPARTVADCELIAEVNR